MKASTEKPAPPTDAHLHSITMARLAKKGVTPTHEQFHTEYEATIEQLRGAARRRQLQKSATPPRPAAAAPTGSRPSKPSALSVMFERLLSVLERI